MSTEPVDLAAKLANFCDHYRRRALV